MSKVLVYSERSSNRLSYVLDFILGDLLGLEYELTNGKDKFALSSDAKFSYATQPVGDELFFECDSFLFEKDIHPQPINFIDYKGISGFYPVSKRSLVPFDMFASAFFMLSRYEEYLPGKKDKYDRYRGKESMNYKGGFLEKPMVDLYALEIKRFLNEKFPALEFKKRSFEYIPTFDIDMAYSYLYKSAQVTLGGFIRSLLLSDFKELNERFLVLARRMKDPFDTYDYIFSVCEEFSLNPHFFFLLGDRSKFDKNISYSNEAYRELIERIAHKARTGIHLSYKSHVSTDRMQREITRMEEIVSNKIYSNRFHYLRFQLPHSYARLIKAGLTSDYSMGYAGRVGFRAGTCTPFNFFNVNHDLKTPFKVYPFAFMDTTFTHYLKYDAANALEKIIQLMQYVKKVDGPFVALWHNSSFTNTKEWRGWRHVFETVAREAQQSTEEK